MKKFNVSKGHDNIIFNRRLPIAAIYGCIDYHNNKLYYYVVPSDIINNKIMRLFVSMNTNFFMDQNGDNFWRSYKAASSFGAVKNIINFLRPWLIKSESQRLALLATDVRNKAISKAIREHNAIMADAPHLKNHQQQLMFRASSREVNNTAVYESVPEVAAPFYMAVGEASQSYLTVCNAYHGFNC